MIRYAAGWITLAAGILSCTTHYVKPHNEWVYLYLERPAAEQVFLVSSVDGFDRHPASKVSGSLWEARVETNSEFRYFYIVDGSVYVPPCRFYEMDDWDGKNCIYIPRL